MTEAVASSGRRRSSARSGRDVDRPETGRARTGALIAVAAVANLGLAGRQRRIARIGKEFDASQTALNLVAVGYSLGLAASVLYFGAVGDRYGRKLLLIVGMVVTVPADCLAAWAPNHRRAVRRAGPRRARSGMAYPTTLALITALWSGPARTKSIALWARTGGAIAALGPLCSGILLEHFWWGRSSCSLCRSR
jgi:MFS family permease